MKKRWLLLALFIFMLNCSTSNENLRGVYFSKKSYTPEPLLAFQEIKDRLPAPVINSHPEWIDMYWACWEIAFKGLKSPPEGSPLVSNWLDEAFSENIFQWDTLFMMLFARYGHDVFPAIQSLDNFYALQRKSGYICREFRESDGREIHFDFDGGLFSPSGWKNSINPPLFSWAEIASFRITGDKSRFRMVLPVLERYAQWLDRHGDPSANEWESQGRKAAGSVHALYWNTPLGSGMDNTPRPADTGAGWVEMSSQMVIMYNDLAVMCHELGDELKAGQFRERARSIGEEINRWCWNEEDGLYYDVLRDGSQFRKKTSGCFWPLLAGIASPEQARRLTAHLRDPDEFWRKMVFPTLAADEPEYHPLGDYWKGGVWAPTNMMIIKGLEKYGFEALATRASLNYLTGMAQVFAKTGTVWENYAPDRFAEGNRSRSDFVGWTGCGPITLLIENVLGFRPDGARNTLTWRLNRTDRHGIRHLMLGDVHVSLVCESRDSAGDDARIRVESSGPFQLIVKHNQDEKVFFIEQGSQTIQFDPS